MKSETQSWLGRSALNTRLNRSSGHGTREVIAFDTPEAVRANPKVQEAYLGSVLADEQAASAGH